MDSFPKLLPMWHDIALQEYLRHKKNPKFKTVYIPSYGGIGIDVADNFSRRDSNYERKHMTYAASKCALPFLPLKKICNNTKEPCLEDLKKEKFEFEKFCLRLAGTRTQVTRRRLSELKSLQCQLSAYQKSNRNEVSNIEVSKNLVNLAESIPKRAHIPTFNVAYAGGTLAISKYRNNISLFHPAGENLNKLCTTPLQNDNENHFKPDFHRQVTANLDKEFILQIEPTINGFCCVRQKNSFHLVNMTDMNIFSKRVSKFSLYHIAVSPFNPMEILSVYEKGMMELINVETRNTLRISEDLTDLCVIYPTWRCGFGSHLFSAMCMNEKKLYSIDYREKNCAKKEIFSIANPSCYVDEELIAMKQWNKNPFQHLLAASHHLIICDERYPKKPVMYWNHILKDPPIYLECADLDNNVSCIVIGTQRTQELATFLFSHETDIQPISLTPPLLLSSPSDCIDSLKLHSYYVDEKFSSRLSCPLSGVCIVPKDKEDAFTVLQSTSLGDIFYQDYKQSENVEKTYRVGTGCVLTPPAKILPHLNNWMSKISDTEEVFEDMDEEITHLQINISKILSKPEEISSNCTACRLNNSFDDKKLVLSEICPRCSLGSAESQHFSKAESNLSAVSGTISEESGLLECDLDYLSGFKDTYSKRILSVWLESEDMRDSQTTYD